MKNFTFLLILSLLAIISTAQQATFDWQTDTLSDGNILQKMSVNGNKAVIAGFGNSFLTSNDGGDTWNSVNLINPIFNLPDISIKGMVGYIVSAREKLYDAAPDVYTNGVILKTIDGGATWETIEAPVLGSDNDPALSPSAELSYGVDFASVETINDSVAFCSARWYEYGGDDHSGVFKTIDGGANWMNVSGDLGGGAMSCISFNGSVGFMGGSKMLFKGNALEDTLINVFALMPGDGSDYIFDIDFVDENEVLVTTTADSVYFSNDGGATFDKFGGIKGGMDVMRINDSTIVVGGGSNKSYVSTDNGVNWSALGISTSIWEVAGVVNDSINMLAKSAIYKCAVADLVSGNYNFVTQAVGDGNLQKAYFSGNNLTITGNDGNFYMSSDAGLNWTKTEMPVNPAIQTLYEDIDFSDLSAMGDEAYVSFNRHKFVDYPTSSDNDDIYWSGGVLYTDDGWETSKSIDVAKLGKTDEDDPAKNPNHESCNGVNPSVLHYVGNDVILVWARWYDYSVDPKAEHSMVFKSSDAGKNWTPITNDLGNKYVQDIKSKGDTVYIVGSKVLLVSNDAGMKSAGNITEFTDLYPILDEGEDDGMFINSIQLGSENEFFLTTSADSCFMTSDGGATFKTIGGIKGANDFYKFDNNSYILMGSSGKSKFTNNGGETWEDCHPGSTIFEIGGVYDDKFYALGKSYVFTNTIANFDLKTSIQNIVLENELNVLYKPSFIELISSEKQIERCAVYSITGKLITMDEPMSRTHQLYNNKFQTGMYIVNVFVEGKRISKKVVFK